MNIKIGKYKLSSNSMNYIISEEIQNQKTKEMYDTNYSYHMTILAAINNVLERRLRESDAITLIELKNELAAHRNELGGIFKEVI